MERWKVNLYTVWFSQVLSLMSFGFGIPFLSFYIQDLGVTHPDSIKMYTGLLNSAPAVTMAVMAPIWGMMSDKWGKKLMLMRAMFFAALVIGGMGMVTNVNQLVVLRLLQGVFTGTVTAASILVAAGTPNNRLSYALGFLSSSTFIGQSIGPVVGGFVAEIAGYRVSFYIGAILMLLDFFLVLFVVKESKADVLPEQTCENKDKQPPVLTIFTSLTVIMLITMLFMRIGRTVFSPYIPLFVQEVRGTSEGAAGITGIISGIIAFLTAVSGLTLSRLGDRYHKLTLMIILLGAGTVLSLPLGLINNLWLFTALYGILFFVIGGIEPIVMSVTAEITPPERRGALFGVQGLVGSIGWAVAPMLGGAVSIKYSLRSVFLLIPAFFILSLIPMIWIMKRKRNNEPVNEVFKHTF